MNLPALTLSWRNYGRYPWQTALSILGIALGIAVVVAIDLTSESSRRGFERSLTVVSGNTTHRVIAVSGDLPETVYASLVQSNPHLHATPMIERVVKFTQHPTQSLTLLGVDPLITGPSSELNTLVGASSDITALLRQAGGMFMHRDLAKSLSLSLGDRLTILRSKGQDPTGEVTARNTLTLVGLIDTQDSLDAQAMSRLVVVDIASAQELLGSIGTLSRIDLRLENAQDVQRVHDWLPSGSQLVDSNAQQHAERQMTRAFETNLLALSLLALLIGAFLIYNAMAFSIVRRRAQFGVMRSIGFTRRDIFIAVLIEALVIGLIASVVGLLLGIVLANNLLNLVVRTINDLYYTLHVTNVVISPYTLVKAVALGLGATVVAALMPAYEATTVKPRLAMSVHSLDTRLTEHTPILWKVGVLLGLIGVVLIYAPTTDLWPAFAGLLLVVFGVALCVPSLMGFVLSLLARALVGRTGSVSGVLSLHGIRAVLRARSRTAIAVAALAVAIAATLSVSLMITSFRTSVDDWLASFLVSDVYLTRSNDNQPLSTDFVEQMRHHPQVDSLRLGRWRHLVMGDEPIVLFALETDAASFEAFQFINAKAPALWAAWERGDSVIVSEPFASRHQLVPGDSIELVTITGPRQFKVAAQYRDYGSDRGVVTMSRAVYSQAFDDDVITSAALKATEGVSADSLMTSLQALPVAPDDLRLRSNVGLREASLQVFDRTFAVTGVIRTLAVVVAIIGIVVALIAIQFQRATEFSLLRAIGLLPRDLVKLMMIETGLMGLMAGLVAVPMGVFMAWILVNVINRRAFGWSMDFQLDAGLIGQALGLAVMAALIAGAVPAYKQLKTPPAQGLRYE